MNGEQADHTRCTLLLFVDGELKEVAQATVETPLNRIHHNQPISDEFYKVSLARVFQGCGFFDPPTQPLEAKSELSLEQCLIFFPAMAKSANSFGPS